MNLRCILVCLGFAAGVESAIAANLLDDFNRTTLNPPSKNTWNPCQADPDNLIDFEMRTENGRERQYLINIIDKNREGPDECLKKTATSVMSADSFEAEWLGPSLVESTQIAPLGQEQSCAIAAIRDDESVTQRNELRFTDREANGHSFLVDHWYSIAIRMEGDIPSCGSTRWVIAQWKYSDGSWPDEFDQSPFLAQRFDNGVFHLTVQNGICRCRIAKTRGDVDRMPTLLEPAAHTGTPRFSDLVDVRPLVCKYSVNDSRDGKDCTPDDFHVYALSADHLESLPDPKNEWVTMLYLIKGGGNGEGKIDIWANSQFIASVRGKIGYSGSDPGRVKFKFGAYRDMFRYGPPRNDFPDDARMLVDEFCVSKYKPGTPSSCDPSVWPAE